MAQDATCNRHQHALAQERAPLLAGNAQRLELADCEEAERLGGPLGDGPVNVVSWPQQ
jgi:hypothetical protein